MALLGTFFTALMPFVLGFHAYLLFTVWSEPGELAEKRRQALLDTIADHFCHVGCEELDRGGQLRGHVAFVIYATYFSMTYKTDRLLLVALFILIVSFLLGFVGGSD